MARTSSNPEVKIFSLKVSGFLKLKLERRPESNSETASFISSKWLDPSSKKFTFLSSSY